MPFGAIKRLFKGGYMLRSLHEDKEYELFALSCSKRALFVIRLEKQPGVTVDELTQEASMRHAVKLEDEGLMVYCHKGKVAIFSSSKLVEEYIKDYSKPRNKVFGFQAMIVNRDDLCESVLSNNLEVVFDPGSPEEFILSSEARNHLMG